MISLHYGALLYALDLSPVSHAVPPVRWYDHAELPSNERMNGAAKDYVVVGSQTWNLAVDLGSLAVHTDMQSESAAIPGHNGNATQFFVPEAGTEVTYLSAMACEVEWDVEKGVPAPKPRGLLGDRRKLDRQDCVEPKRLTKVRFVPYGGAKVRMSELPYVDLGMGRKMDGTRASG